MTVRIDNDFWANYGEHEILLKKCFTHLYFKKYPVAEGSESAYNFVVMEFFRKGIFERFDADRKGVRTQTSIKGKTTNKKFEQYIYKWVESVMYGLYHNARKHTERYLRFPSDTVGSLNEASFAAYKAARGTTPWVSDDEVHKEYKRRKFPNIGDSEEYHAETALSALEQAQETEINSYLDSVLKDARERKIIASKRVGFNNSDIARDLEISSSQVGNILKSIRSRCGSFLTE